MIKKMNESEDNLTDISEIQNILDKKKRELMDQ
jgi:hypothetical protein